MGTLIDLMPETHEFNKFLLLTITVVKCDALKADDKCLKLSLVCTFNCTDIRC